MASMESGWIEEIVVDELRAQSDSAAAQADENDSDVQEHGGASEQPIDSGQRAEPSEQPAVETAERDVSDGAPSESPSGERIGEYTVVRALDMAGMCLAEAAGPGGGERDDEGTPGRYVLVALPGVNTDTVHRLVERQLNHPRVLAPRAVVSSGDAAYLVLDAPDRKDEPYVTAGHGGRLDPRGTLRTGAGLADGLAYLHRSGIAHLHVSPETVLVHAGRAYLFGLQDATILERESEEQQALFARDANFLARTLGVLAGLEDEPPAEGEAADAVGALAARGVAGELESAEDLSQLCARAVQQLSPNPLSHELPSPANLSFRVGTATSVGMVRAQNQDAVAETTLDVRDDITGSRPVGIFVVADGMGGEAAGEVASRIGARMVTTELVRDMVASMISQPALELTLSVQQPPDAQTMATALARAVQAANQQVRELAAALGEATGSTLTAMLVVGAQAVVAHLGDSRAYLLQGESLIRLTEDHSLLARMQAMDHPLLNDPSFGLPRNFLYRSLGQDDEAPPDLLELRLQAGDRILLCSDGLWDELDDATIGRALADADDPQMCADLLVRLANAAGGHDNSTALVAFVQQVPADPALAFRGAAMEGEFGDVADFASDVETPGASTADIADTDDTPGDGAPREAASSESASKE